jgi:hypothetical protein
MVICQPIQDNQGTHDCSQDDVKVRQEPLFPQPSPQRVAMWITKYMTGLTHFAIGIVATVILLVVLFQAGFLVYDGTMVQTMPLFFSTTTIHTPYSIETTSHLFATSPFGVFLLAIPMAGLFAWLSYALFARRK